MERVIHPALTIIVASSFGIIFAQNGPTNNSSSSNGTDNANYNLTGHVTFTDDSGDIIPKAVISVVALLLFFGISIAIAKLIDYCYDQRVMSDDSSDISDYSKEILKAQVTMVFKTAGAKPRHDPLIPRETAKRAGKTWRAKAAMTKIKSLKAQKEAEIEAEKHCKDPKFAAAEASVEAYTKWHKHLLENLDSARSVAQAGTSGPSRPSTAKLSIANETHKQGSSYATARSGSIMANSGQRPLTAKNKWNSGPISAGLKTRPNTAKRSSPEGNNVDSNQGLTISSRINDSSPRLPRSPTRNIIKSVEQSKQQNESLKVSLKTNPVSTLQSKQPSKVAMSLNTSVTVSLAKSDSITSSGLTQGNSSNVMSFIKRTFNKKATAKVSTIDIDIPTSENITNQSKEGDNSIYVHNKPGTRGNSLSPIRGIKQVKGNKNSTSDGVILVQPSDTKVADRTKGKDMKNTPTLINSNRIIKKQTSNSTVIKSVDPSDKLQIPQAKNAEILQSLKEDTKINVLNQVNKNATKTSSKFQNLSLVQPKRSFGNSNVDTVKQESTQSKKPDVSSNAGNKTKKEGLDSQNLEHTGNNTKASTKSKTETAFKGLVENSSGVLGQISTVSNAIDKIDNYENSDYKKNINDRAISGSNQHTKKAKSKNKSGKT